MCEKSTRHHSMRKVKTYQYPMFNGEILLLFFASLK